METNAKPAPKSGANLFVAGSIGKLKCQACGKEITDRAIAVASHARSHVRAGTVEESGNYGDRVWRLK